MRLTWIPVLIAAALMLMGTITCGAESEEKPSPSATRAPEPTPEPDRMSLLQEVAEADALAFEEGHWLVLYARYPDEFKEKCTSSDFAFVMMFALSLWGMPDDFSASVETVRIEGDQGWVDIRFEKDGLELEIEEDDTPSYLWRDGEWVAYVSPEDMLEDKPCDLSWETDS